ncbi:MULTISPECIES: SDR family oxidoreductase [Pseudonocardia]|uniref:3-oxoacyl-[acyl-carrier-protein] reductase FabG n=2 Tax=Pseudonocardia TaxID=1847 RepID=A0A1Y2MSF7_PSEAH|nr:MULTISPECIES: SDR family oxidoreductase [Pseudonocardia]OSY38153.1 3-oxoacyl-[acyl-carrier-protein] reductase FabG [Pseudonocardia autotrophica]TDN75593.1 3-oxoacyl-[acyl-carrier protein] reductase [Pseudonocardia autotrophica]BBF99564.1 3-oxoacyl-ACP reductase [Pseudonocardia autotrophica]GEC27803.1 3-oxoacyl-ACP reductase [Pseudonocardia saturnea]
MDLGIAGRAALVCASTSGLGLGTARALAADGARVVITGRTAERAEQVAATIPGAVGVGVDLTADGGVDLLLEATREAVGSPDILVLNGPGPAPGTAADVDAAGIEQAVRTLVLPQQRLVAGVLPTMIERGWGRILSISSTSVQAPIPRLALSNVGRSALLGYLKTLAGEVARHGITVNTLLPGRIETPRVRGLDEANAERLGRSVEEVAAESRAAIPMGRYGDPDEFGAVAAFLCSGPAGYVTGSAIRCDGGLVPTV